MGGRGLAELIATLIIATALQGKSLDIEPRETSIRPIHVRNLSSLRSQAGSADLIVRDSYAAIGDSPPVSYRLDAKPCARADGGAQVPASSGGCWLALLDRSSPLDARIWGARCDDFVDDGPAFSNALFALGAMGGGRVFVPATGRGCRIATGIKQTINGTGLVGNGDHNWAGPRGAKASWFADGSWLDCVDRVRSCVKFDGLGFVEGVNFWQDQPAPAAGWAPIAYPWAIEFMQNYSHARNIFMANIYEGLYFHGRPTDKIYGSHSFFEDMYFGTFRTAVRMDSVNNTMTCSNVHVALEWQINGVGIQAYLNKNGIGFDFHYVDNFSCTNVEFYKVAQAMRFTNGFASYGAGVITHAAAHLVMSNVSFNLVPQAIAITAPDVALSAQLSNVLAQTDTDTGVAARCFLDLQTDSADVAIYGFEGGGIGKAVGCVGVPNGHTRLKISGIDLRSPLFRHQRGDHTSDVSGYDYLGGFIPAFSVAQGATVELPTGWQDIVPGSTTSGPHLLCADRLREHQVEGSCGTATQLLPTAPAPKR